MEFMSITPKKDKEERFVITIRQGVIKINKEAFVSCAKLTLEDAKKIVENALCAINCSDGEKE